MLFQALIAITGFFLLYFLIKPWVERLADYCVICISVTTTWVVGLVLYFTGYLTDPLLLALLMGTSVTGGYYYLDAKYEVLHFFRLPLFLSLLTTAFSILSLTVEWKAFLLLSCLWVVFGLIYGYRTSPAFSGLVKRVIECCKNW